MRRLSSLSLSLTLGKADQPFYGASARTERGDLSARRAAKVDHCSMSDHVPCPIALCVMTTR